MSWTDFHRRQEILEAATRHAGRNPGASLSLDEIPGAADLFGCEEQLLLALHYKWTQVLSGYLRAELADPDEAGDLGDQVDAVTRAWRRATTDHEPMHAVLDAGGERHTSIAELRDGELRMLAVTAGLADPREDGEEIVKVGHAFEALLRTSREEPARRRPVMGHLRRLLAPSA